METIKDRLLLFIESQHLSISQFERSCELGNGYVTKERNSISEKVRPYIEKAFPMLNLDWVKTGEGEMILADNLRI